MTGLAPHRSDGHRQRYRAGRHHAPGRTGAIVAHVPRPWRIGRRSCSRWSPSVPRSLPPPSGRCSVGLGFTMERVVTVLVIACPHALGLAIPLVVAISTTLGARHGLLVRDRRGLEEARLLNAVVFDKTGTLTLGSHRVVKVSTADGIDEREVLRLAAAAQQMQISDRRALLASAGNRALIFRIADFESMPGRGVRATVEGRTRKSVVRHCCGCWCRAAGKSS